jgi:hypothetical protein
MGNAEFTDGVWVWPEGLWVYVQMFNVVLPDEFVDHMKSVHFEIPKDMRSEELDGLPVDFGFWRKWCSLRV